jgi:UDP-N-acetylmuramoyl-L-alanyl-D-glutamate--2,6-diaminopimelate ligase|tara:strand:- start:8691 stop:10157 length:1467 start_codon:yes stop_codon:yes gene_type:complete
MNELEEILGIKLPKKTKISYATNSTKKIKKDTIFFGLKGSNCHGSAYAEEAINLGACIVVHNDLNFNVKNKKIFYVNDLENKIINFLNSFYGIDINNNNFFSFTGTNGKTSAAYLCHQLLENRNFKSIYVGTLGIKQKKRKLDNTFSSKTTPDIFELFEIISSLNLNDPINICIEISSHALDQNRLSSISYMNSTSILNISSDHLDYHKNLSSYIDAKFKIFKINSVTKLIDDKSKNLKNFYKFIKDNDYKITSVSNKNNSSDIFFSINETSLLECKFNILINNPPIGQEDFKDKIFKFSCCLFPEFNICNLVFAICSLGFDHFSADDINDLSFLKLPKGRVELIKNIPANIIIDYAHNSNAFKVLLNTVEKYFDNLVVVFGCGGNRDKTKRPKMLGQAIKSSSKVIFTSDNSRNESFSNIFKDSKVGNKLDNVIAIEDRKEAIIYGSKLLGKNDCMIILGKGHEETQEIAGKFIHHSDHEVVYEIYS